MDFKRITEKYYSLWVGGDIAGMSEGINVLKCDERNKRQPGYSVSYDLYVLIRNGKIILSYGDKAEPAIETVRQKISDDMPIEIIKDILQNIYGKQVKHHLKFVFEKRVSSSSIARKLDHSDFDHFLQFFKTEYPDFSDTLWLQDYFTGMVKKEFIYGIFNNDTLASCNDAPEMPYMQNQVQEIGINTLEGYRKKGYATDVCSTCIKNILSRNICPLWSTEIDNIASERLAYKVGFSKFADVLTLSF